VAPPASGGRGGDGLLVTALGGAGTFSWMFSRAVVAGAAAAAVSLASSRSSSSCGIGGALPPRSLTVAAAESTDVLESLVALVIIGGTDS